VGNNRPCRKFIAIIIHACEALTSDQFQTNCRFRWPCSWIMPLLGFPMNGALHRHRVTALRRLVGTIRLMVFRVRTMTLQCTVSIAPHLQSVREARNLFFYVTHIVVYVWSVGLLLEMRIVTEEKRQPSVLQYRYWWLWWVISDVNNVRPAAAVSRRSPAAYFRSNCRGLKTGCRCLTHTRYRSHVRVRPAVFTLRFARAACGHVYRQSDRYWCKIKCFEVDF
jgi:hypothetical protein